MLNKIFEFVSDFIKDNAKYIIGAVLAQSILCTATEKCDWMQFNLDIQAIGIHCEGTLVMNDDETK